MASVIMTGDAVKGGRRVLQPAAPRQMQPDRCADPVARARELLGRSPSVYQPSAELVRLLMTCGTSGVSYTLIAERHEQRLVPVGHELPQARRQPGGSSPPGLLSGEYRVEFPDGWACPLCGNNATWVCNCAGLRGALQCCGPSGGRYYCACGRLEERHFVEVEKVNVRGASVAATPNKTNPHHGQPTLKQVTYNG